MERNQFTFYRSFWNAAKSLPKKDRLPFLEAVIAYIFEDTPVEMSDRAAALFSVVQPVLEASNRKAESGSLGGSKLKANQEQIAGKDNIKDKNKIKDKCPPPQPPLRGGARQGRGRTGNVFAELLREELS